jgi:hypothetical protein
LAGKGQNVGVQVKVPQRRRDCWKRLRKLVRATLDEPISSLPDNLLSPQLRTARKGRSQFLTNSRFPCFASFSVPSPRHFLAGCVKTSYAMIENSRDRQEVGRAFAHLLIRPGAFALAEIPNGSRIQEFVTLQGGSHEETVTPFSLVRTCSQLGR